MSTNFDKQLSGDLITAAGVRELRRAAGANEVPKTTLAGRIGVSRQTITERFKQGDMKLSEFVACSLSLGSRPSELLAKAEQSVENTSALAGEEVA